MPIHEKGYRHYEGKLRGRLSRSLTIARCGTSLALKKRGLIAMVLLGIAPAFVLAVLVYQASRTEEFIKLAGRFIYSSSEWQLLVGKTPTVAVIWQVIFSRFFIWQLIPVAIVVTYVGPELISQDLRVRALQVYYARPITRLDYVLGKLMVVAVFVAMLTLVPAVLIYIVGVVLSKSIVVAGETWPTLVGILGGYLLITVVAGVLILACSSLSRRSGSVAVAWAMLVIVTDAAHGLVGEALGLKWSHLLSLRANVAQLATRLFDVKPEYAPVHWSASLFVLAAVVVVALGLLFRRVQVLEGEH
ncbi:MAG TPA: hypothetical protein VMZ92_03915 [Planctomycetota bacterium]|nr:hypothetical protein [Planctomycetota bacterium]